MVRDLDGDGLKDRRQDLRSLRGFAAVEDFPNKVRPPCVCHIKTRAEK